MRWWLCWLPAVLAAVGGVAAPGSAAEYGTHLAVLAASYGDELYDRRDEITYYDDASHLVRDRNGRLNVAESSLNYAAALLAAGEHGERALQVIDAVLARQDSEEGSPTRGLFPWMGDESAAPDAVGTTYLAPALAYVARTVADPLVQARVRQSVRMALDGLLVAPERSRQGFGLAMWAGAVCSLAAVVDDTDAQAAAAQAVNAILNRLRARGLDGVHSPTFDALRIGGLRWAWQYALDDQARAAAALALRIYYADMLQRYAPESAMITGAIGSAYAADYLGQSGVSRYLLACDLPSAVAACRDASPLAMYFALSEYVLPPEMVSLAEGPRPATEVRTRTPAAEGEGAEANSTCTWIAPGMSLGTMSGPVDGSSIPVLATCDLPERPTSYFYLVGGPATVQSVQSGSLALCSFNFDGIGVGLRQQAAVRGVLGRRDQIDRVIVGRHEWIGEPEAVGQNGIVAVQRGSSFVGVKILDVAVGRTPRTEVKPGVLAWYAEGNMDSLMLTVYGRRETYRLPEPLFDVRVALLVEVQPAAKFGSLKDFAEQVGGRRVTQEVTQSRARVDQLDERRIPGRHEITAVGEMRFANYLRHTMTLVDEALPLGLTEELLRNRVESRTLPMELPTGWLWASPALNLSVGGELSAAVGE